MTNSKLTDEHFNHLADVMLSMFGHKWRSQYGLDIDPLWRRCLADLDPEELQRGVAELGHQGAEWPPSLPEFRKLCHPPAEAPAPPCHRLLPRDAPETAEQKAARKVRGRAALDSIYKRMPHLRCGHRGPNPGKRVEDRTGDQSVLRQLAQPKPGNDRPGLPQTADGRSEPG